MWVDYPFTVANVILNYNVHLFDVDKVQWIMHKTDSNLLTMCLFHVSEEVTQLKGCAS